MVKLFESFPQELKDKVQDKDLKAKPSSTEEKVSNYKKLNKKKIKIAKEYAFTNLKKLPLDGKRQVLSAMEHLLKVKKVSEQEIEEAYKKILKVAESYEICTMGFNSKFEQYLSKKSLERDKTRN